MEHEFSTNNGYAAVFMLLNAALLMTAAGLKAEHLNRLLEHTARYAVSVTPVAALVYILYSVQKWY